MRAWALAGIVHSWKSYSATMANRVLGRTGSFWSREYFDRVIRDEAHYANAVSYAAMNPVKAGLCKRPDERLGGTLSRVERAGWKPAVPG